MNSPSALSNRMLGEIESCKRSNTTITGEEMANIFEYCICLGRSDLSKWEKKVMFESAFETLVDQFNNIINSKLLMCISSYRDTSSAMRNDIKLLKSFCIEGREIWNRNNNTI